MRKFSSVRFFIVAGAFVVLLAACGRQAEPDFEGGWVRAMPPGSGMTSGYGTLRNRGREALVLESFASPAFGEVSLHRTEQVDGMARMREVERLTLEPGQTVTLEPGGLHLMLMMPGRPLAVGDRVSIEMTATDGRVFRFELPVEAR